MKIIFSHGKESGPRGTKIEYLSRISQEMGYETASVDYQGIEDPDERVRLLVAAASKEKSGYILAGSSMGGYVSIVAASHLKATGVFLLAPAIYMPGYENKAYALQQANVSIVHGWNDEIIPWQNSLRFAQASHCELHLFESDHRLLNKLEYIGQIFKNYISTIS